MRAKGVGLKFMLIFESVGLLLFCIGITNEVIVVYTVFGTFYGN